MGVHEGLESRVWSRPQVMIIPRQGQISPALSTCKVSKVHTPYGPLIRCPRYRNIACGLLHPRLVLCTTVSEFSEGRLHLLPSYPGCDCPKRACSDGISTFDAPLAFLPFLISSFTINNIDTVSISARSTLTPPLWLAFSFTCLQLHSSSLFHLTFTPPTFVALQSPG